MLRSYKIEIPSMYNLQKIVPNPTKNPIPSLYDLSNATIGINLEKKKRNKKDEKKDDEKEEEGRRERRRRTNIWLGQSSIELRVSVVCRSRCSPGL
jgi:hypothetical protein